MRHFVTFCAIAAALAVLAGVNVVLEKLDTHSRQSQANEAADKHKAMLANIQQRLVRDKAANIAAAVALADSDPEKGLEALEPYKKIDPAAIVEPSEKLNAALLKKRLNVADLAMQREDFDAAVNALLAYGFNDVPPAVRAMRDKISDKAAAARAVAQKKEVAFRKSRGVEIGMTAERVLQSSWGRPQHVNRTTTANGTREQWVYSTRNYLYFENGILTTIQN